MSEEREVLYRQAVVWLESGGGRSRWETLLKGVVRCTVTLGNETCEAVGYGELEAARQNALLHAIEELQSR
ncbi:MAG: hypothetical protein EOO75_08475 [Myxococcales bacterium]|nr:MAG: hypothetical protein EOO75_08475 [Myxococcales bacterium]